MNNKLEIIYIFIYFLNLEITAVQSFILELDLNITEYL